jgi:hypothetical protein
MFAETLVPGSVSGETSVTPIARKHQINRNRMIGPPSSTKKSLPFKRNCRAVMSDASGSRISRAEQVTTAFTKKLSSKEKGDLLTPYTLLISWHLKVRFVYNFI